MNKSDQIAVNILCKCEYQKALTEMESENIGYYDCKRLRSCSAWVYETTHYYILRSYGTFIAVLDKKTGCAL